MGIAIYPTASSSSSSPIKSIQRGAAAGAGTVNISSIDTTKSFVNVYGTASSGNVIPSFNVTRNSGTATIIGAGGAVGSQNNNVFYMPVNTSGTTSTSIGSNPGNVGWNYTATVNAGNTSIGAGSNNLIVGVVSGYISSATTLEVTGACRYEVVEYV